MIGYFLVKFVPNWGLALIGTTFVYLAPLVYIKNQAAIDSHLENAGNIMSKQTEQMRSLASQHTNKAMEATSSATKQYAAKAQEMMGGAKKAAVDQGVVSKETAEKAPGQPIDRVGESAPVGGVQHGDFPNAPKTEPAPEPTEQKSEEPVAL